ncbi:hypothetical protein CRG98_011275, partial [Punica granatum]
MRLLHSFAGKPYPSLLHSQCRSHRLLHVIFFVLRPIPAGRTSLFRALGRRHFSVAAAGPSEELSRRNYANNVSEYNTV